ADAASDREDRAVASQAVRSNGLLHSAARKRDQVLNVAAVEWQFENSLILDDLTDRRTSCFNQRRIGLNLNLFGYLSDFQHRVHNRATVNLQDDSRLCVGSESQQSRFQPVWAQSQIRENVRPRFIGYR